MSKEEKKDPTQSTLAEQIANLQLQIETLQQNQQQGVVSVAPKDRVIPRSVIEEYLNSPSRPDAYFVLNPLQGLMVRDSSTYFDRELGMEKHTTPIAMNFDRWHGPGSELKDDKGELLFRRGIGFRVLSEWPELKNHADVNLDQIKARISDANKGNEAHEKIMFEAEFKQMLVLEYGVRDDIQKRHEAFENERSALESGEAEGNPRFAGAQK
jgi:hypothetical protein